MKFHPLAEIFPLLEGVAFDELVADIKEHGVREPVWVYQDQILDGRNRWRAAEVAGREAQSREYTGDDPLAFVISLNLHRRQLNDSQRSLVAVKIATMKEGRPSKTAAKEAFSQTKAAELLNVTRANVQRARKVIDKAAPEVVKAVESGKVRVSTAAAIADAPKEEQAAAVAKGSKGVQALKRKVSKSKPVLEPMMSTLEERLRKSRQDALNHLHAFRNAVLTATFTPATLLAFDPDASGVLHPKGILQGFFAACGRLVVKQKQKAKLSRDVRRRIRPKVRAASKSKRKAKPASQRVKVSKPTRRVAVKSHKARPPLKRRVWTHKTSHRASA